MLAEVDGHPVLARQGRFLVASFHPELTDDTRLHELFLEEGGPCPGIASGRRSSTRRAPPTRSAASSSRSSRARSSSRRRRAAATPPNNLALQNAIEKASSYSMPKDNIERAIAKGTGEGADGAAFETVVYEGYGPEGVAVIVEALTDNKNRTASDVRHAFSKHGGSLGATGAVAWQFERRGVVVVPAGGRRRGRALHGRRRRGRRGRRGRRRRLPGHERAGEPRRGARGDRGRRLHGRLGRALDGARRRRSRSRTSPPRSA